jgi:hypothetical protein
VAGTQPAPAPARSSLPPLAAPTSASSTAALASGGNLNPLDPRPDLRAAPPPGSVPRAGAAGATLRAPEFTPASQPPQVTAVGGFRPVGAGSQATTFEQLQQALRARSAWQRLETLGEGQWRFTCSVANPQNPNVRRTYEATAADPVTAMRATLEQIDRRP